MQKLRQYLRFMTAVQLLPALESGEETLVGGQAVLEGVMMRSPHAWGISVRKPDGTISTHSEPLERLSEKHKWMGWPVIRGVMTLGQAMTLGFRALRYSADVALDQVPPDENGKKVEISGWVAALNIILSVGFFIFAVQVCSPGRGHQAEEHLSRVRQPGAVQRGRRRHSHRVVPAVYLGRFADARHSAGVPVSRRRAQDRVRVRVARSPRTEKRAGLFDVSSALRDQLPDDRDADLDCDLHAVSGARICGEVSAAHRAAPGNCRPVVRDDSLRREARKVAVRAADQAGPVAATDHHQASERRAGRVRDLGAQRSHGAGKSPRRRTGHRLAAPAATTAPSHNRSRRAAFASIRVPSRQSTAADRR